MTYGGYYPGCLSFCLTEVRPAKVIENDLAIDSIEIISARGVFIKGISVEVTSTKGI